MIASLALALLHDGGTHRVRPPPPTPNVLVIVLDDVGHPDVEAVCENVQALAAQGINFTRGYSMPVCSPSRVAALYGAWPRRYGIGNVINAFNPSNSPSPAPPCDAVSLAEVVTCSSALIGKWHLGNCDAMLDLCDGGPVGRGFDVWLEGSPNSISLGQGADGYYDWYRVNGAGCVVTLNYSTYATDAQRDAFLVWMSGQTGQWFAWLAFNAAHAAYDAPPGYQAAMTTRGQYLDVLDYADAAIGAILATIDLDDTYVILFGDNGTPDEARPAGTLAGRWKGTTYEGGVCVPLMIAGPGITPATSSRLVALVDVPATVCELLGVSHAWSDSQSMLSGTPRSWVFAERYDVEAGVQPEGYDDVTVIEKTWKLRRVDADGNGPGGFEDLYYVLPSEQLLTPAQGVQDRLQAELASLPTRP